jgi:acyl carrier protein
MNKQEVEQKVLALIKGQLFLNEVKLTDNIHHLGADSLDQVEFLMALEEAFDIDIPDEEGENFVLNFNATVANLVDWLIANKLSAKMKA